MDQLGVKLSLYEEQCVTSMISENQVAVNVAVSASKTSTEDIDDCRNETSKSKGTLYEHLKSYVREIFF